MNLCSKIVMDASGTTWNAFVNFAVSIRDNDKIDYEADFVNYWADFRTKKPLIGSRLLLKLPNCIFPRLKGKLQTNHSPNPKSGSKKHWDYDLYGSRSLVRDDPTSLKRSFSRNGYDLFRNLLFSNPISNHTAGTVMVETNSG